MDTRGSKQPNREDLICAECGKTDCATYRNNYDSKWYCFAHSEYGIAFQE